MNFKNILRNVFGGDIDKMTTTEFAAAVEKFEAEMPPPKEMTLEKIRAQKVSSWRTEFDIGLARFVAAPGTTPCTICAALVGKYTNPIDADFFLEHSGTTHGTPLCLTVEPATMPSGGSGSRLPQHAEDEDGNILDGMALVKIENEMYAASHPEEDEDEDD